MVSLLVIVRPCRHIALQVCLPEIKDRGEMMFGFLPTKIPKSNAERLLLILLVPVMSVLGSTSCAVAGCGDYLLHTNHRSDSGMVGGSLGSMPIDSKEELPQCANGECRSAPIPVPHAPTSYLKIRKHTCDVCRTIDLASCVPCERWFELSGLHPDEPFLELPDPPPRRS